MEMRSSSREEQELHELCELVFENRATMDDVRRLEALVLSDERLREIYVQRSQEHAWLAWNAGSASGSWRTAPEIQSKQVAGVRRRFSLVPTMLLACLALFIVSIGLFWRAGKDSTFAKIVASKSATWENSELPTMLGSRLAGGRMKLRQGMVSIAFDCGGTLSVEGPAEFAIVSDSECRLISGRLVGRMEKGKTGLTVLTERARLVDLGTEFGVYVDEQGTCRLVVFEGEVECQLTSSGYKKSVTGGMTVQIDQSELGVVANEENSFAEMVESNKNAPRGDVAYVTTGSGNGRDCFITEGGDFDQRIDDGTLLLVKEPLEMYSAWRRRAYLAFDLRGIDLQRLESAELCLTLADSKIGFADHCPDATFTVYGLTEQQLDYWRRDLITWENSPGVMPKAGTKLDDQQVTTLGQFVIQQGRRSGTICLKTEEFAKFLQQDTNDMATIIIVRETRESAGGGTAHAFASGRHPTLAPPTLRLIMRDRVAEESL